MRLASFIYQPGQPSFVDADRAMWDYNPILTSGYVNSSKAGHGRLLRRARWTIRTTPGQRDVDTFAGMIGG